MLSPLVLIKAFDPLGIIVLCTSGIKDFVFNEPKVDKLNLQCHECIKHYTICRDIPLTLGRACIIFVVCTAYTTLWRHDLPWMLQWNSWFCHFVPHPNYYKNLLISQSLVCLCYPYLYDQATSILLITLCPFVCPSVRPSVRVSWFENANNSTTAGTRRTKFGTQVGWPGPVIVLKFQHTATDGAPSARARVRHWLNIEKSLPDEQHARPEFIFLATKTEPFKLDNARKRDFAAAARVLFVLAIIKNKVFCQVMLGFQRDVSSDINARFTLAINTIKHYENIWNSTSQVILWRSL